jgi:hypothetical protein
MNCICGKEPAIFLVVTYIGDKETKIPLSLGCAEQIYSQLQMLFRAYFSGRLLKEEIGMKAKITKAGKTGGEGEIGTVIAKIDTDEGVCAYIVTPQNPKGYLKLLKNVEEVETSE